MGLGATPWRDQRKPLNIRQCCQPGTGARFSTMSRDRLHKSTITRLKNFPSLIRSHPSHKTGCNSMARSGKSFNGSQWCQPGMGARFSTLSGTRLCDPQEYNYQVEKLHPSLTRSLPSHKIGCNSRQDQGNPSTADNVANLVRAPGFQPCL